jgi:hypothetical protein
MNDAQPIIQNNVSITFVNKLIKNFRMSVTGVGTNRVSRKKNKSTGKEPRNKSYEFKNHDSQ